jgi:hypothetical protein
MVPPDREIVDQMHERLIEKTLHGFYPNTPEGLAHFENDILIVKHFMVYARRND